MAPTYSSLDFFAISSPLANTDNSFEEIDESSNSAILSTRSSHSQIHPDQLVSTATVDGHRNTSLPSDDDDSTPTATPAPPSATSLVMSLIPKPFGSNQQSMKRFLRAESSSSTSTNTNIYTVNTPSDLLHPPPTAHQATHHVHGITPRHDLPYLSRRSCDPSLPAPGPTVTNSPTIAAHGLPDIPAPPTWLLLLTLLCLAFGLFVAVMVYLLVFPLEEMWLYRAYRSLITKLSSQRQKKEKKKNKKKSRGAGGEEEYEMLSNTSSAIGVSPGLSTGLSLLPSFAPTPTPRHTTFAGASFGPPADMKCAKHDRGGDAAASALSPTSSDSEKTKPPPLNMRSRSSAEWLAARERFDAEAQQCTPTVTTSRIPGLSTLASPAGTTTPASAAFAGRLNGSGARTRNGHGCAGGYRQSESRRGFMRRVEGVVEGVVEAVTRYTTDEGGEKGLLLPVTEGEWEMGQRCNGI
ncbi:hypothetical protein LTS18_011218 [Coniosporium uncinatum]|uniref:Uncharacterized protein n=1 Tax=Coniosporium uncinatum TaxID=93489 RepID=A0ACC3CYQ0_9PEZI|nr:hypothetical protein LTS18_011218 [Coniosporium uncinatum]